MITRAFRRRRSRAALSGVLVLAVAVMHIVMVGCVSGGPINAAAPADLHMDHHVTMSSATSSATEHAAAAPDCVMGAHACVFVRTDAVVLTITIGLVLAVAPLGVATVVRLTRRGEVLGRSPPWAIPDHIELSVIRR